jgi:hypothetical protein
MLHDFESINLPTSCASKLNIYVELLEGEINGRISVVVGLIKSLLVLVLKNLRRT